MERRCYRLLTEWREAREHGQPLSVWRVTITTERADCRAELEVDDDVADPAADLFVVLADLGKGECVALWRGVRWHALSVMLGFKGQTFLDPGYFYCPYVPLSYSRLPPAAK